MTLTREVHCYDCGEVLPSPDIVDVIYMARICDEEGTWLTNENGEELLASFCEPCAKERDIPPMSVSALQRAEREDTH